MSVQGVLKRFKLEIEKIQRGQFPTKKELLTHLIDNGFEVSERTLDRDIERLRVDFGVEVTFDNHKQGYFIETDGIHGSIDLPSFIQFLDLLNNTELLSKSLLENKKSYNHIVFDYREELKGIKLLKPLLEAIKNKHIITFSHFNFETNKTKKHKIKPVLLKEYENRWYVVGITDNQNEFRTYGIDRIENLVNTKATFKLKKDFNPADKFNHTIGLVYSQHEVQKVVLSFTPKQGNYIKTLPLHASQKVLADNKNECRISIKVSPNYELIQQILKHGNTIKVIEPEWLANEVKSYLEKALKKYQ